MVFQNYALYPHMSVAANMSFGLERRRLYPSVLKAILSGDYRRARAEETAAIRQRVRSAAAMLGIEPLLHRKPRELSGGQRQRVAVGRAIVRDPAVFLFDEPLSNLDAELRVHMRAELSKLQRRLKTTTVYVTHDQVEAMTMGHRICVLRPCGSDPNVSNLTQIGTPMEIYDTPANLFTAGFMGTPKMNLLKARLTDDGTDVLFYGVRMPVSAQFREAAQKYKGREVILGIRPEHIGAAHEIDWQSDTTVSGAVEIVEPLGHEVIVHFEVQGETVSGRLRSHVNLPRPGDAITLQVRTEAMHLFDPKTEQRLR
jgi:multiple sugar transport system ATP-binding protein